MIERINRLSEWTGKAISWLTLAMVLLTFVIVIMRRGFDSGHIWMQEAVIWMHAAVFMLGAAFALKREQHVRVDVFYRDMSERGKAWVDALGVLVLLYPVCGFFFWESFEYVMNSWRDHEGSRQAQGLGYPATPLLKSFLLLMPTLVALQATAMLAGAINSLRAPATDKQAEAN